MGTIESLTSDAFEKWLLAHAAQRYRPFAGVLVSFAIVGLQQTSDNKPIDVLASCRCMFSDETLKPRETQDYGSVLLGEEWILSAESIAAVSALSRGQRPLGGAALVPRPQLQHQFNIGKWQTESGWPEHRFEARFDGQPFHLRIPHDTIVRKGLRPWSSGALAITKWVWGPAKEYAGGEIPGKGELVVVVPDTRARIVSADWKGSRVTVIVATNVSAKNLELQAVCRSRNPEEPATILRAPEPTNEISVSESCAGVEVYLVHDPADLIGEVDLRERGDEFDASTVTLSIKEQAEKDLRSNESQTVEYKPFVLSNNEKESELVETVVAFANSGGGTIYIGVTDDGTPQGAPSLNRAGNGPPSEACETLIVRLQKITRERIKPVPVIECHAIDVFAAPVIVAKVLSGEDRPYSTHDNNIWIRKGSTNKRPDPKTELPALSAPKAEAKPPGWPPFVPWPSHTPFG